MVGLQNVEDAQGMEPVTSRAFAAAGEKKSRQMDKNDAMIGISSLQDRMRYLGGVARRASHRPAPQTWRGVQVPPSRSGWPDLRPGGGCRVRRGGVFQSDVDITALPAPVRFVVGFGFKSIFKIFIHTSLFTASCLRAHHLGAHARARGRELRTALQKL